jgi:hypothetical protein
MTDRFDQYVAEGRKLIEQHPDWNTLKTENELSDALETAATDQIATILHGLVGRDKVDPGSVMYVLELAERCFLGDYEDMGMQP